MTRLRGMTRALGALALVLGGSSAFAQVSVTATAGTPGPTPYTTLKGAFDAVNDGTHQGDVTIAIVGDTVETVSATLNASGGTASYTSVVISPSGGVTRTIAGAIAGPLVDLNGADAVTIDGLNTGGDALVIANTDTSAAASTIRFIGDASGNVVTHVNALGASGSVTSGTILFSTGVATGNDDNLVSNSSIGPAAPGFAVNGIASIGTATAGVENSGNTVSTSNVFDTFSPTATTVAILLGAGNTNWTLSGNRVFQTATRNYTTANTHRGIQIGSGSGHAVSLNTIGFATSLGTGVYTMTSTVATRFIGIDLAVGTTALTSVQGNTVSGISLATSSGAATTNGVLCGINITAGNVSVGNVTPNVIGGASGNGLLSAVPTTTQGMVVGINTSSTGTIVIQNNTIGGLLSSGATPAVAGGIAGINVSGAATSMTISGNTIGNPSANSMQGGTSGLTTGSSIVSGINLSSTPLTSTVTNNTVQNLSSFGTGAGGFVRGIWTAAATGSAATYTISGNTISTLVSDSALTTLTSGQAGAVGINLAVGTNGVVSNNTISGVARTNTGLVAGFSVGITTANATTATVSRNRIFGITNASTATSLTAPGVAAGIIIRSGTTDVTVVNNMISLGTGETSNTAFLGIQGNHGSTPDPIDRVYYNTINISGTVATGGQPSFGFIRGDLSATARTAPVDVRNNLITNTRTGGTGVHLAIGNNFNATATATGWGANASNFNLLNADAATVGWWGGAMTFAGWKAASASDAASFSGMAVSYVNPANDLHLNMGTTPTVLESGGTALAGHTTDFDLDVRPGPAGSTNGGAFAPDLGADEFDGVPLDLLPPGIAYAPPGNTTLTANRVLNATITDLTGVPVAGALQPRIYYQKNGGGYVSTQCALSGGTGNNGTWACTVDYALVGGAATGDVIDYFVIAQDTASPPNIGSNPPGVVATDVNTVTTPPTPNTYSIVASFPASMDVGAGQTVTSLTNAGGLFSLVNAGVLTENVTVNITSDLSGETGAVALNQWLEDGAGGYTLLLKPSGGAWTVNGNSTTAPVRALIRINGADRVTIDGSQSGGSDRSLTFVNADTSTASAVILFSSGAAGAQNDTVKNVVVSGSGSAATFLGISFGGAAVASLGTDNDNNRVENCDVRRVQFGIVTQGASVANKDTGTVITGNVLNNQGADALGKGGIIAAFEDGLQVTRNQIGGIVSTASNDVLGISLGGLIGWANTTVTGGSEVSNAVVTNNVIADVRQTNTFSAAGILVTPATTGTNLIADNVITGVLANGTAPDFGAGIFVIDSGTDSTTRVYHNSVSMTGTLTGGTQHQFALAVNGTDPPLDSRDNVLLNTQATGSGSSYAVGLGYTTFANLTSDFNDLFVTTGAGFAVGRTGSIVPGAGGTDQATLLAWQTATARDAASLSVDPLFRSATDLHLQATSPLLGQGTVLAGLTADVDGDPLPATGPDIGADEVVQAQGGTVPGGSYYNALLVGGDTLAGDVTVTNELTLGGVVTTGSSTLGIGCTTTLNGAGPTAYVDGAFRKSYCANAALTFEVGTANGYSPVDVEVTAGTPADFTVRTAQGPHPAFTEPGRALQRYWTLGATSGVTANLTFHYLDPLDVPPTANESLFEIFKYEGVFSTPGGTVDTTLNQATINGVTSFSDWTLSETGTPVELMQYRVE